MKKFILIFFIFNCLYSFTKADNIALKPAKHLSKTLEKLVPFNLIKQVGKKITKFGGKEILFGATAASLLATGLTEDTKKSDNIIKSNNLVRVEAKGQINLNGIDENQAKRRALEDALYFASMKAGAEVQGFSSIDEKTNLNENFIVKPNNQILDYKITKSYVESNNYIVEVEAIVGNLENSNTICSERKIFNIKEFKGNYIINTNTPSWAYNYIDKMLYNIRRNMLNNSKINYVDNSLKEYDFNNQNFDKTFDYKTLVNGSTDVVNGDYIYIPSFSLKKSKIFPEFYSKNKLLSDTNIKYKHLFDSDALSFNTRIEVFNGVTNTIVTSIEEEYYIPINIDSNFEIIELFSKKDKRFINDRLDEISNSIFDIIYRQLSCKPVIAEIEVINDKLAVPLGEKQGLRINQLAVLEDNKTNNITMLSISELRNNNAILSPLNSKLELNSFSGKQTRFLE